MASPAQSVVSKQPEDLRSLLPTLFGEGYGVYEAKRSTFILSFAVHTLVVVAVLASALFIRHNLPESGKMRAISLADIGEYIPLPPAPDEAGGGGGGGDRDKLQASKGDIPKFDMDQKVPPTAVIRNQNPKLVADPSIMVPPQVKMNTSLANLGDPSAIVGAASNGVGFGGGIGSGGGGGVGSGDGRGLGPGYGAGTGGGYFRVGGGVTAPRIIEKTEAEFSEEARKARYQGVVVLTVIIGSDGRVHDMRVQRGLGMGLDEKAKEAVKNWRFEPAKKDGRAVPVQVSIEVNFRLY